MNKLCEYCNGQYDDGLEACPHCGGENFGQTDILLAALEKYHQQLYKNISKVRDNG